MNLLNLLWHDLPPDRRIFVAGIALTLIEGLVAAVPALAVALLVARLAGPGVTSADVGLITSVILLATAVRLGLMIWVRTTAFPVGVRAGIRLRLRLIRHLLHLPIDSDRAWPPSRLGTLLTDDAHWIGEAARMTLFMAVAGLGAGVALLAYAVMATPAVGVVVIIAIILALCAFAYGDRHVKKVAETRTEVTAKASARVGEYAEGMAVFRTFGRAGDARAHVADAIATLRDEGLRGLIPFAISLQIGRIVVDVGVLLAVAIGIPLLGSTGDVTEVASIAAALMVTFVATEAIVGALASQLVRLRLSFQSAKEINRFFAQPIPQSRSSGHKVDCFDVAVDAIAFAYPGAERRAIDGVSFTVSTGSTTAIVGPSGAGKSTLLALVNGDVDPQAGRVRIGGIDRQDLGPDVLRKAIAVVGQDVFLFGGTIAENLRLADPMASDATLRHAIEAVELGPFIAALPTGLDTRIGPRGYRMSAGERHRLTIARALLKDSPILLLDEAMAAVDPETERRIQTALARLTSGRTVLVVSHRLRGIADAGQIIVLDNGRIAESGRHDDLLAQGGRYAALWAEQARIDQWALRSPAASS